jgi:hypothetical protein
MSRRELPPLPGVDAESAPGFDDPGYQEWLLRTAFSPEGVDRMLIWEMLHRTPAERLATLESLVNDLLAIRGDRAAFR